MTFSLRSILLLIAVVAVWLGALMSGSPAAIELAAVATNLSFFVALAMAIWHRSPEQRAFWTGFCVLGIANLVLANHFAAYQQTGYQLATAIVGEQASTSFGWTSYPPLNVTGSGTLVSQPFINVSGFGGQPGSSTWLPTPTIAPFGPHEAIRAAFAPIVSLILACAGGWFTFWIARSKSEPNAT